MTSIRELCSAPLEGLPPRRAFAACKALGSLARWWLRPRVLRLAHEYDPSFPALTSPKRPSLPETPGSCWVVFLRLANLPLLRPALLLPLSWRPMPGHSAHLPDEVRALADRVLADLSPFDDEVRGWGLHPADVLQLGHWPLETPIRLPSDSGWAALAGGLLAARAGLTPDCGVWVSGAWGPFGLGDVNGLPAKLRLAINWEAKEFFVPIWRVGKAEAWVKRRAPGQLRIGALTAPVEPKLKDAPLKALMGYLARLTKKPPIPDPDRPNEEAEQFERCRQWFLFQPAFNEAGPAFYWSHLLPGIIRRLRIKILKDWPSAEITHFATIVSPSSELAVMAPLAVGASHCLLLHTPDPKMEKKAEEVRKQLESRGVCCFVCHFDHGPGMESNLRRAVDEFTEGVEPSHICLDLKPGTKKMTYSQSRIARPGNWLFNLEAKFLEDRRNDPGTERPELWQAGP